MWSVILTILLALAPHALLQTENYFSTQAKDLDVSSDSTTDYNLCLVHDVVSYTITEQIPLEEYGTFETFYKNLGITGSMRGAVKTKLEPRQACCPGYVKASDGSCQLEESTTPIPSTELIQSSTETIPIDSYPDPDTHSFDWLICVSGLTLCFVAILLSIYGCYYLKKQRILRDKRDEAGNELEVHRALFSD